MKKVISLDKPSFTGVKVEENNLTKNETIQENAINGTFNTSSEISNLTFSTEEIKDEIAAIDKTIGAEYAK